jgi:hypothetical protein
VTAISFAAAVVAIPTFLQIMMLIVGTNVAAQPRADNPIAFQRT